MAAKTSMDEIEVLPLPLFAYILMYECFSKGRFLFFLLSTAWETILRARPGQPKFLEDFFLP